MSAPAAVILPTAGRPNYLDVALASIAGQTASAGAEVLVVDDGPGDDGTLEAAARHGARYVRCEGSGLNAARNTGARATDAPLLIYVDDDVRAHPGWLAALLAADAAAAPEVGAFAGRILARFEDHRVPLCGREDPPVTHLDLGPADRDCRYAWGANMAVRRTALEHVGPFDEAIGGGGDEEEWQDRLHAAGGRVRYVAGAVLDHRRAGDDARLRTLCRAAYARGRGMRRYDRRRGRAPSLGAELSVLARCLLHGFRFRCANGPVLSAHSLGRVRAALAERLGADAPPAVAGVDDFLAGRSGLATGRVALLLRAHDLLLDLRALAARPRLRRAARALPVRRVLAIGVVRSDVENRMDAACAQLRHSRHDVVVEVAPAGAQGKFQNLNTLLAAHDVASFDWVVVLDDDVALPGGFLDAFLAVAERGGLQLAQPAHRRHSHAAWDVARRRAGADWRETTFVEIGPVTAFSTEAAAALLPFPDLRMGWGLDAHWAAVARERGWRIGVVDATPIDHTLRPTAEGYPRDEAAAEARTFLSGRPYVRRDEVRTLAARTLR